MSDNINEQLSPQSTPSSEEIQLARVLKELLGPDGLKEVLVAVLSKNAQRVGADKPLPHGWEATTNAPWYKEKFALEIKPVIDEVWATKQQAIIFYHDDPAWKSRPNAVRNNYYQMVNQAWLYLREEMDEVTEEFPDGKYKTLRSLIAVSKTENASGIVIRIKSCSDNMSIKTKLVPSVETSQTFFNEVFKWVEEAKMGDRQKWDNLTLSPDDMAKIQTIFDNPAIGECFLRQIAPDKVILMKHKELE